MLQVSARLFFFSSVPSCAYRCVTIVTQIVMVYGLAQLRNDRDLFSALHFQACMAWCLFLYILRATVIFKDTRATVCFQLFIGIKWMLISTHLLLFSSHRWDIWLRESLFNHFIIMWKCEYELSIFIDNARDILLIASLFSVLTFLQYLSTLILCRTIREINIDPGD